tara:strand:+ start:175 stop:882 length:708 start_codon:yes stop_codon:yes gene_type:complete
MARAKRNLKPRRKMARGGRTPRPKVGPGMGGGGPRPLPKRKRPIRPIPSGVSSSVPSGRTILGPSNPGNNIMWETWEVECPSRGESYTNNDPGSFQQHVEIVAKDCPDWRGSASSHEKGGKVGGRAKYPHGGMHGGRNRLKNTSQSSMIDLCIKEPMHPSCRDKHRGTVKAAGGRAKPRPTKRRMATGGRTNYKRNYDNGGSMGVPNQKCKMINSRMDCDHTSGCTWDFSQDTCK